MNDRDSSTNLNDPPDFCLLSAINRTPIAIKKMIHGQIISFVKRAKSRN